jgi:phosphatidylserine/phosphatidylglycerophosphate/cardiolipin synthase-like enzyme
VAFEEMWKAVDSATHSVTWHTYIAKDDHVGKETLRRLVAAARRGCRVQFLYDCAGNISGRDALVKPLIEAGGEVVRFRPFFRSFLPWLAGGAHWRKSPAMRTHRKILVVDDRVAFTGGLNVGNEYAGPQVGGSGRFRDSHCRVDDPESVFFLARACRDTIEPGTATRAPASRMRWRRWAEREATVRAHMVRTIADRIVASGAAPKFSHAKGRVSSAFARQMRLLQLQRARLAAAAAHGQGAGAKAARRVREVAGKVRVAVTPRTSTSAAPSEAETTAGAAQPTSNTSGSSSGTAVPSKAEANAATAELLERAAADEAKSGGQYKLTEDRAHPDLAERIVSRARDAIHGGGETLARVLDHVQVEVQQARIIQAQQGLLSRDPTAAAFDRALIAKGVDAKIRAQLQRNVVVVRVGPDNNGHMHALAVPAVGTTQILLCNPFSRNWGLQMALWHAVQRSACRVWVTTPYLLPHRRLYQAMVSAAKRGVDVRVLTGSNTTMDPWFMWYAQQYMTHRLLAAGVRLYEYDGGAIMHAKTVVVDGTWAVVGSYNWDLLSNKLCEAAAAALDPGVARTVEQHFAVDCSLSRPITADVFASRSWWVRLMCVLTYNGLKVAEYLSFWRYTDYDLTSKID